MKHCGAKSNFRTSCLLKRKKSMKKILSSLIALVFIGALTSCSTVKPAAETSDKPAIKNLSAHTFSTIIHAQYSLFLPEGYHADSARRWPLILFLHGIGECGTDIWKTTVHGPAKYIEKHPDFPFIVLMPQCPVGHQWSDDMVLDILDHVTAKYNVDTNRIYLTGLSLGGFGAWSLATLYPERFAAAVPISGGDSMLGVLIAEKLNAQKNKALKSLPIWAFHCSGDPTVPVAESERMVKALKDMGCRDVRLTIYPRAQHDAWTQTYNNPKLYQWLLSHRRE
jgi:predicted peptidase